MIFSIAIIALMTAFVMWLGIRAQHGHDMNLEQWTVAGRGFGSAFVFLLLAGEIYTTFTFLGASGFAYGLGGPAFYIIAYGSIAYTISYYIMPPVWRFAKEGKLINQSDYFKAKFSSSPLGIVVAIVGLVALIPYLVLQFKGLGIIVHAASYGYIGNDVAIWIGAAVVTIYVMFSGVRGSAWTSVIKDAGILAVVIFLGIYLPSHYYGGIESMFHEIDLAKPNFLALPSHGQSVSWYVSTVLLSALGFFMWPHTFSATYTARSERIIRKNAVILPFYQLVLLFVYFVGFAAILKVPGLKGPDIDLALFKIAKLTFSPAVIGIIGAVGVLAALVPGSLILMNAATLLANNIYWGSKNQINTNSTAKLAKGFVPIVALVAVIFTLHGGSTIVSLLIMGYSFVTQLFPALLMSIYRRNAITSSGAISGIVAGVVTVAIFSLGHFSIGKLLPSLPPEISDINVGIIALILNILIMFIVSAIGRKKVPAPQSSY
jgi:SSS family solute:Na+ symporter